MKHLLSKMAAVSLVAFVAMNAPAQASSLKGASENLSRATATMVNGSAGILRGGSEFVVASVQIAGEVVVISLKGASGIVEISLKTVTGATEAVLLATGEAVKASSTAAGTVLAKTNGEVIAFLPNDVGRALNLDQEYRG